MTKFIGMSVRSLLLFLLLFFSIQENSVVEVVAQEQTCTADGEGCDIQNNNDPAKTNENTSANSSGCMDNHESCGIWASSGECDVNPTYMHTHCQKSCLKCSDVSPEDYHFGGDMGVRQVLDTQLGGKIISSVVSQEKLQQDRKYMETLVVQPVILEKCKNSHELCNVWSLIGECEANPTYMKEYCGPACHTCTYSTVEGKCPINPETMPDAWGSGDLDKMFTRLTTEEPYLTKYSVQILSQPPEGPWVITMDNLINETEADHLIELGGVEGYQRSSDYGKMKPDGTFESNVNAGRTSTNAWCTDVCYQNATARTVMDRLSDITGIPERNSEYLQLLRYNVGQHYQVHHDYILHETRRQQGPRILTVYLYLNEVEEGGGTNFDLLNVTVMPKRGRVLLWPSVLDESPNIKDGRTTHQALSVEKGIKYGANAWFHLRDFKTPHGQSCI